MTTRSAGTAPTVATWQYISGAQTFNSQLDARLLSIFDARAGGRHEPAALPATPPAALLADGVSVTHEIVLATGSVVGSRFVQTTMAGGVRTARSEEITYEDLSTGVVTGSASLIKPAMTSTLRTILGDAIGAASPPTQAPGPDRARPTDSVSDAELLTAVAFTSAGDLSVTVHRDPRNRRRVAHLRHRDFERRSNSRGHFPCRAGLAHRRHFRDSVQGPPQPAPGGLAPVNCDLVACAALTYDDGPNAQTTRLLAILDKHRVFATFFQQGGYVKANPTVAKAVAAAGHTIANHTMSTRTSPNCLRRASRARSREPKTPSSRQREWCPPT